MSVITGVLNNYASYSDQVAPISPIDRQAQNPSPQTPQGAPLPQDTVTLSSAALQASIAQEISGDGEQTGGNE